MTSELIYPFTHVEITKRKHPKTYEMLGFRLTRHALKLFLSG